MLPDCTPGACGLTPTRIRQPVPSGVGRVSHGWPQAPGSSQPPDTAFDPASQVATKSPCEPGPTDHGAVLIVIRPAAVLAGPGALAASATASCARAAASLPPSFLALSAMLACFARFATFALSAMVACFARFATFALSAVNARLASGTTALPTAKAVPDSATNNASSATAIAG